MDTLGATVLIAGLFWLTRRTLAGGLVRNLNQGRNLPRRAKSPPGTDALTGWGPCRLGLEPRSSSSVSP